MDISKLSGELQQLRSRLERDHELDLDVISKCRCQTGTPTEYLLRVTANVVVRTRNAHFLEVR